MFPSVAKEDVRDKIKEKTWDDRFGTKSGIPEYSPLKDKHTKNYRKSLKKEDSETKEGKPAREGKRTYFEKRMELMDELATMHRYAILHLVHMRNCSRNTRNLQESINCLTFTSITLSCLSDSRLPVCHNTFLTKKN